ncbi:MAG: PfkB family carbohydrate kinase [Leptolyngbyaceae cyanobacterium MO_188.B28]|nr:PfkB family carbohydrate kinase [Leptolyngbyaceae cyanobacterium MO_188.B28]
MPCAVILTALPVECLAVGEHMTDRQEEIHPQGTIYEWGKFLGNGQEWVVGLAEIGAGSSGAAVEAERAISHFKPDVLFFVGIAGGIKDVDIGDVVAATKVYGYESGKVEDQQFFTRPTLGQSSYALVQRARSEKRKGEWIQRLSSKSVPEPNVPNVYVAPIVAGEKVVASRKSEIFQFLRESYNDAIAVEMEGFGFLSAVFAYPNIRAIVIRGISDLINNKNVHDPEKGDEQQRQERASRNASAFAFEVLANFQVEKPASEAVTQADKSGQQHYILVVGGSNGENIIQLPFEFKEDRKYTVEPKQLFGGSCINYSIRLMNFGLPVIPIPDVGQDRIGDCIQKKFLRLLQCPSEFPNKICSFVESKDFFVPGATTNYSTILIRGEKRTILAERGEQGDFLLHLEKRLDNLGPEIERRIKTVIIGHIYADSERSGECTKLLIDRFPNAAIFANFGRSQINHGFNFWQEYLPKISVFQLNLDEIKNLFQVNNKDLTLREIVRSLTEKHVTSIITMNKLGAICSYNDGSDGLIVAPPFKLENIVDPTGAGDAFGAAIASHLFINHELFKHHGQSYPFYQLQPAVKDAQTWAAYACQHFGGANNCPSKGEIDRFKKSLQSPTVQVIPHGAAETILDLLDIAYSPIT